MEGAAASGTSPGARGEGARLEWERPHAYGPRVHVLSGAWVQTALARIGSPATSHPELLVLVRALYHALTLAACGHELSTVDGEVPTRMAAAHPQAGVWRGELLDPAARIVVVDVVRGGMVPSQVAFELLTAVLPLACVRLDHLHLQREADERGRVCGVRLTGSKIGGSVEGATLLVPDPMGATGGTVLRALEHYAEHYGTPGRIVALPMIATPEFLRAVLARHAQLVVYTGRIDRGLSPPEVLAAPPGARWDEERGLDERGYIVPGAGGVGEVLNNAWC